MNKNSSKWGVTQLMMEQSVLRFRSNVSVPPGTEELLVLSLTCLGYPATDSPF